MNEVSVRDLRNNGAAVLRRVESGDRLTVTRDGEPVADLVPLPRRRISAAELVRRRQNLPVVNIEQLRADLDDILDPAL